MQPKFGADLYDQIYVESNTTNESYSGPILESKGMRAIFQKKGKKGKKC